MRTWTSRTSSCPPLSESGRWCVPSSQQGAGLPRAGAPGTGRTKTGNLLLWLEREAAGEMDSVSKRTGRDFYELARQNGFVVGLHPETRLGRPRRLDLVEAREMPVTDEWAEQHGYRPNRYRKRPEGAKSSLPPATAR